ncbi:metal ABC transporter substrate-binding protein [Treponema sp.]
MERRGAALVLAIGMLGFPLFAAGKPETAQDSKSVTLIATIFPLYDFARNVGGDRVDVSLLLPPGLEAHGYEPTPHDMAKLSKTDVFVYTNPEMEGWAEKLIASIRSPRLIVVNASENIHLSDTGDPEHKGVDPHVWLDPLLARELVKAIAAGAHQVDPEGAAYYTANAETYIAKLERLHGDLEAGLKNLKTRTIVYGGHFAFGYFARRYKLEYISPYSGFSPDAEPTPKKVAELTEILQTTGNTTVFFEELIEPRVATALSKETGAKMVLLHGAHNVSKEELKQGQNYLAIMRSNLEVPQKALGSQE